jgi:beta-lactamase regulating signal transducer with metallopeptidase domain
MWKDGIESLLHVANFAITAGANLLVQSTLLIGGGLLVAWFCRFRGAALRSAILRVPVVALVLCPIATLVLGAMGVEGIALGLPRASLQVAAEVPEPPLAATPIPEPEPTVLVSEPAPFIESAPAINRPDLSDPSDQSDPATAPPAAPLPTASLPKPATPAQETATSAALAILYCALTAAWAIVCAVLLIRLMLAHIRMAYVRRSASPAPSALIDACAHFAGTMNVRAPLMLMSKRVHSPCLVGLLRPAILLPADSGDSAQAHHEVIVHELAHLARRDCAWNLLCRVVRAVLCFQPLAWTLTRRIEDVSDDVADDHVVRHGIDRRQYVRRLVDIAKRFQPAPAEMAAGVGVVAFKSSLGRRVQRILDSTRALSLKIGLRAALAIVVLAACSTVAGGLIGAAGDGATATPDTTVEKSDPAESANASQPNNTEGSRLQFRWVAKDGDTAPADELPVHNPDRKSGQTLRVVKEALLDASDFRTAQVRESESNPGELEVLASLSDDASGLFASATEANIGRRLAIVFDGEVLTAPVVQDRITSSVAITGSLTRQEAQAIATAITGKPTLAPDRGRVSGVVTNARTGEPVAGAFVAIDHSGDAGGANLGRLKDEGIYVTAETDQKGRFILDNVAFNDAHPFYVTCPDFVRHERQLPLTADEPSLDIEVALKPAARLNIAVANADGTPYKGPANMRLEAADHRVFLPPKDDWPRFRHNTRPARDGDLFTFGELDGGVFSIEAFAMAEKVPKYIGKMTGIELADGETKNVVLHQATNNSKLVVRVAPDPFKSPDNPFVVLVSRHASDLMWANKNFYHPEDHRLGRVMEHAILTVQAGEDGVAVLDNPPPEAFSVIVLGVGQYLDIKNLGVYLRGARVEVAAGDETTVEIPWVEPVAPGHAKTYYLGNTVAFEPKDYACEAVCAMLTAATGDRVRFVTDPSIQGETVSLGRGEKTVWDVIESLHDTRGWVVIEGDGDTFVLRPGGGAAAADPKTSTTSPGGEKAGLAWQRIDTYIPPDTMYFPDDAEGGKALDALYDAVDKDTRPDDEVLTTVRNGLRRTRQHQTLVLRWIGNRFIWGKDPQNAEAIELMYHAVPLQQHYAIYFGLSVVKDKSPNILKTLADIAMATDDPNDLHRIAWGCDSQKGELLAFLEPYLASDDDSVCDKARIRERIFKGELKAFDWAREQDKKEAEATVGERLPEFREKLLNTKGKERLAVLKTIQHNGVATIMDDSFLDAMVVCAEDPDPDVRRAVARMAGNKWVWSADKQPKEAIDLMLRLSRDEDRETRNQALYFGLSTVKDKDEPVIRRLVELALVDHDPNQYGRVTWGITAFKTDPKRVEKVFQEFLDSPFADAHTAASVYFLYRDLLEHDPPNAAAFAEAIAQYPDDLFNIRFGAAESFKPDSEDALWHEFAANLPEGLDVERGVGLTTETGFAASVLVRGEAARKVTLDAILANPKFRPGPARPVTPQMQLFLEERERGPGANPPKAPRPVSRVQTDAPARHALEKLQQAADQIYKDEQYKSLQAQATAYVRQIKDDEDAVQWYHNMRAAYRAIADYETFFAALADETLRPVMLEFWRAVFAKRNHDAASLNDDELVAFVQAGLKEDADRARETLREAQQTYEWPSYVTEYCSLWAKAEILQGGAQGLAEFRASQQNSAIAGTSDARVLHFPTDRDVGEVIIAEPGAFTSAPYWWPGSFYKRGRHSETPPVTSKAQGDVPIPPGKEVGLVINWNPEEDASWFAALVPDDLTYLTCMVHGGQMPPVTRLTGLKVLKVAGTGLGDGALKSLNRLASLERLALCCALDGATMAAIGDLSALTGLHLRTVKPVTGEDMIHLSRLSGLQEVHLTGSFDEAGLAHLAALPSLRSLRLVMEDLSGAGLAHLAGIQSLQELNVDEVDSADMLESISQCSHLKKLILDTFKDTAGLGYLVRLPELESLELAIGSVTEKSFQELGELRHLKSLRFIPAEMYGGSGRSITDASLESLSAVASLESLELYEGRFTDAGMEHLARLKNLRSLRFSHDVSGITEEGIAMLASMPNLEELNLGKQTIDLEKYRAR